MNKKACNCFLPLFTTVLPDLLDLHLLTKIELILRHDSIIQTTIKWHKEDTKAEIVVDLRSSFRSCGNLDQQVKWGSRGLSPEKI